MKSFLVVPILIVTLFFQSCQNSKNDVYNGFPLIKAENKTIDYKVGDDWTYGRWRISPQIENDTLKVVCYSATENFIFRTDRDSILYDLKAGDVKRFYIMLKDSSYAHTIVQGVPFIPQEITYSTDNSNQEISIFYRDNKQNSYLEELKTKYPLNTLIENAKSDAEKILIVLNWTNHQWKHNGNNSPKKNDAISILDEAKEGGQFPCFAYAIVLRDQLNAIGYNARTIYLKTKNAQTSKKSPGHVATEVYLNDLKKWVFIDGQFNVMPFLDGIPLNAIELQKAISDDYAGLNIVSKDVVSKRNYVNFVYDYLYYLDTSLGKAHNKAKKIASSNNKRSLMLVPLGAKELSRIDFWNMDVDYCIYTTSSLDFYAAPNYKEYIHEKI